VSDPYSKHTHTILWILVLEAIVMAGSPAFPPVGNFELSRYLGTWYEIARLPNWFEKDLVKVTATYSVRDDGKVKVLNQGSKNGKKSQAVGKAKFAASSDTAHLKVSFFWIFYADYIVVELDSAYTYALVAGDTHKYLWILSRTPVMNEDIKQKLLSRARQLGFDTDKLYFTPQGD